MNVVVVHQVMAVLDDDGRFYAVGLLLPDLRARRAYLVAGQPLCGAKPKSGGYWRARRRNRAYQPVRSLNHGTVGAYVRGCRCAACAAVNAARVKAQYYARKVAA